MASPQPLSEFPAAFDYEDSVIASLRPRLDLLVTRLIASGSPLPDPEDVAAAMAAVLPDVSTRSEYDGLLGPFYSSTGVMRLLGVPTKQALDDRRKRGTVLAARTSDGVWAYPALQFDVKARSVRPELKPVLAALRTAPRWGAALWLVTGHPDLDGRPPLEAVSVVTTRALVRRLAAEYAQAVAA